MKSRSAWFENGTEKARKLKKENSKRLIKSAILGNADTKTTTTKNVVAVFAFQREENTAVEIKGKAVKENVIKKNKIKEKEKAGGSSR